ncbi:hypothetical protein V6N12_062467 [Hibiscus sabdariffa]|uniref:Endonuclease/exonuclease/phosphatase domain-containing protein n=1 Tax=Hibiscus sabdariffa TaxID=183260 RepID=A0ABR2F8Y8_9ROSI
MDDLGPPFSIGAGWLNRWFPEFVVAEVQGVFLVYQHLGYNHSCFVVFSVFSINVDSFPPMATISWNVRGLSQKDRIQSLKLMNAKYNPDIIFLSENKQKQPYLKKIRKRLKFDSSFYIDPLGIAGGMALWWKSESNITILSADKNYIDTSVSFSGEPSWFCSFIYAPQ